jgi:5-methylcytosine-specific restriction endonuclease McrA
MIRREIIYNKFGGKCAYCGCDIKLKGFQVDHIVSLRRYRSHFVHYNSIGFNPHLIDNLNPSCQSCNNYKRDNTIDFFRTEIESQIEKLRRHRPTFRLAERYGLIECKPKRIEFYFETIQKDGK